MASQAAAEVAALAATIRQQHAAGKAEWALAPGAAIRYAKLAGEVYVGGVYVRLFMKNPRYAIRDPKRFSEALLHKFLAELQGAPGSSGGSGGGAEHTSTLLLLSAAAVALLQGHALLADHVAQLGYASRLLVCLGARTAAIPAPPPPTSSDPAAAGAAPSVAVAPDEVGGCILRLLHQLAASPAAAEALASASSAPLVPTVMKAMAWGHGATLLVLELLKRALAPGNRQRDTLVGQALSCGLPQALLAMLDWRQSDSGGGAGGAAAAAAAAAEQEAQVQRALAVDVLTALAEEGAYGPQVAALLAGSEVWSAYRGQRHDMFLPSGATADSGVVGLLTAGDTARYALPPTEDPGGAGAGGGGGS
jgi:DnaJ family protein C protein 13